MGAFPSLDLPAALAPLPAPMRGTLKAFVAVLLAFLWLPATSHCSLDAASDLISGLCDNGCSHSNPDTHAHADACLTVESGNYTAATAVAHAPAPSLTTLACLACLHARLLSEARTLSPPAWAKDHPLDWIPAWTFTLRAAPLARAPDLT